MTLLVLILYIATIVALAIGFIWVAIALRKLHVDVGAYNNRIEAVEADAVKVFTDEFREQLRNHGRLYFEKIINNNAMFLQQDLHLTASQLNDYMKESLESVLKEEFAKYTQSIEDAKNIALGSIKETHEAIEAQRDVLLNELKKEVQQEKDQLIHGFEERMGSVLNEYVIETIGDELDISSQAGYIFARLEEQKDQILEDLRRVDA